MSPRHYGEQGNCTTFVSPPLNDCMSICACAYLLCLQSLQLACIVCCPSISTRASIELFGPCKPDGICYCMSIFYSNVWQMLLEFVDSYFERNSPYIRPPSEVLSFHLRQPCKYYQIGRFSIPLINSCLFGIYVLIQIKCAETLSSIFCRLF